MTTPTWSAKPTLYRGVNFRSRLEAKWAAFFDLVGWEWTYEPFDADGYIPDFLIHGNHPMFVEVGPCVTVDDYRAKAEKADSNCRALGHDVLVVGVSPISPLPTHHLTSYDRFALSAGYLGEYCTPWHLGGFECDDLASGTECSHSGFAWGAGAWAREHRLSVFHDVMDYAYRPHGESDGGHPDTDVASHWINALWAKAGNETQWRSPMRVGDFLAGAR